MTGRPKKPSLVYLGGRGEMVRGALVHDSRKRLCRGAGRQLDSFGCGDQPSARGMGRAVRAPAGRSPQASPAPPAREGLHCTVPVPACLLIVNPYSLAKWEESVELSRL